MKSTLIAWYDHHGRHGWHEKPDDMLDVARSLIFTMGFIVAEDEHSVVVSATVSQDRSTYDDTTAILKAVIHKRADMDLVADDEDDDDYLVVGDDTSYADLFDPPDDATHTTDPPRCGGPI